MFNSGKIKHSLNLGQTFESSGVEINENAFFLAALAPNEPTMAPPPKTPTTKS